jgi:hypothetical protein
MLGCALQAMKLDPRPKPFIDNMLDAVNRFAGDYEQRDDIAMLAIRFKGGRKMLQNNAETEQEQEPETEQEVEPVEQPTIEPAQIPNPEQVVEAPKVIEEPEVYIEPEVIEEPEVFEEPEVIIEDAEATEVQ